MLRAWLLSRFANGLELDDVVQEAFLRVIRAHERGQLDSPKAFLFATARNLALDRIRHQRVAPSSPLAENEDWDVLYDADDVAETVARNQELELLTEAIQSLPDRCRQVFTLRVAYGLSQKEIAARLGRPFLAACLVLNRHASSTFRESRPSPWVYAMTGHPALCQSRSRQP